MKEFHYKYKRSSTHVELEQYVYRLGTYHYNWHRDLELFWLLAGKAEVCSGGVSRIFEAGDLILIKANEGHTAPKNKYWKFQLPSSDMFAAALFHQGLSCQKSYPHSLDARGPRSKIVDI